MAISNELLYILIGLGIMFLLGFFLATFFMKGIFWKLIVVKTSKGKKILVRIYTDVGYFFLVGVPFEDYVKVKYNKQTRFIKSLPHCIQRVPVLNINWMDVDDESWLPVNPKKGFIPEDFDHVVFENFINRILTRPTLGKDILKLLTLLGVGLVLMVSFYTAYSVSQLDKKVSALPPLFYNITRDSAGYILENVSSYQKPFTPLTYQIINPNGVNVS